MDNVQAVDATWRDNALETLVFHELRVYNHTNEKHKAISYYRTRAGLEVDFVVELERRICGRSHTREARLWAAAGASAPQVGRREDFWPGDLSLRVPF